MNNCPKCNEVFRNRRGLLTHRGLIPDCDIPVHAREPRAARLSKSQLDRLATEEAAGRLDDDRDDAFFGGDDYGDVFVNPFDAIQNLPEAGVPPHAPNPAHDGNHTRRELTATEMETIRDATDDIDAVFSVQGARPCLLALLSATLLTT